MKSLIISNLLISTLIVSTVIMMPFDKVYPAEIMSVDSVLTCDLSDNPKTLFNPGDDIRYKVNYTTESLVAFVLIRGVIYGNTFKEILPWQYGILSKGSHTTTWDSRLPPDASGTTTLSITYIGIMDSPSVMETTFIIGGKPSTESTPVGSDTCRACHPEIFDSLQNYQHRFIECEFCHGPGSEHVSSPSPDNIIVDTSSSLCGRCHTRGDGQNRIETEDDLIKYNQQFDELLAGSKISFECVQCHDPHVSLTSETHDALTSDCTDCHNQTINKPHMRAGLECTDCHMPDAVKKNTSSGEGIHLKGDAKTHIFTINTTANPSDMYYPQSGKTFADGFLTLNFVCLGCHNGILAMEREFDWAVQGAALIHSE